MLCCASGMHRKIGAGGRLRLRCGAWGESCEALGSSQQSPTRAFLQPAQAEAHSGELAKTLTRSSSCYLHSRHNDSLPISPIKHTHSQFLFFSFLLFRLIHRPPAPPPTTRSSTRASRCHASLARLLAFRGTILLELRVRDKDAPALLSQQHPRNTASSPSSSPPPPQSPPLTLPTEHTHRRHPAHRQSTAPSHLRRVATQRQHALHLVPRVAYARTPLPANPSRRRLAVYLCQHSCYSQRQYHLSKSTARAT